MRKRSLDDPVGAQSQGLRDGKTQSFGGPAVDDQLERRDLFNGRSPGLAPLKILST